ncbi:MAG TPA: hypothetical protein GXX28_00580, partial [Firmicutes bacterium]|nr:hypothetical protein [Bacillota bacterium]
MRTLLGLLTGLSLLALSIFGLALSLALSQPAFASGDVGLLPVAAVHASPTSDPGYPALNLTDAAPGSIWRSSPGADAAWAVLDFGEPFRVDYARLYVPGDFHGELTLEYQDEGVWRPLAGGAHLAPPTSAGWREVDLGFDSVVATQLRLFLRGTGREPFLGGLGQVEFYGDRPVPGPSRLIPVEITSSSANPGLPAAHLADGNTYTRWETPADQPSSAWVVFRFAEPAQIAALKFYGAGEASAALTWEYWADGTWLAFPGLSQLPLAGLARAWHRYDVSQPFVTTDQVRLVVENRGGLSKLGGFGEVEVWGTPLATPPASLFARRTFWAPAETRVLTAAVPSNALFITLPLDLSGFSAARLVFDARDVDNPGEIGVSVNGSPAPALTGSSPDAWGSYALPLSLADLKQGANEVALRLAPGSDGVTVDNVRVELLARDGVALPVADGPEADRRALTSWQVTAGPNGSALLEIALPGPYQLEELALFAADRLNQGIDV